MATKRGRKSAAAIAAEKIESETASETTNKKPEPTGLNFEQLVLWHNIIASMPDNWFDAGCEIALIAYVRHTHTSNLLSAQIETYTQVDLGDSKKLVDYDRLLKLRANETKQIQLFATSLRLTLHSRLKAETAYRAANNDTAGSDAPHNG